MIRWVSRLRRAVRQFREFRARLIESGAFESVANGCPDSKDLAPWEHPYLATSNITRFRAYSEQVWQVARAFDGASDHPLKIALCVNMAQSMTKWGRLARENGIEAVVFPDDDGAGRNAKVSWVEEVVTGGHHQRRLVGFTSQGCGRGCQGTFGGGASGQQDDKPADQPRSPPRRGW